jgi:DNA repair protein RecO (recombination protein O)
VIEKDLGFVLKRINFRETSLISTIFTRRFGKINGILKGFYLSKKEFTSTMDTFTLNEFIFYPKKTQIWLVSYADLIRDYLFLREDYQKNLVASKFIEIIQDVLPLWDKNEDIFNLLSLVFSSLQSVDPKKISYIFFIKFLSYSGFKPEFRVCLRCSQELEEKGVSFSSSGGGLLCRRCRAYYPDYEEVSGETISTIFYIQKHKFPIALRVTPSFRCEEEILNLLDRFLNYHLDFNLLVKVRK